MGRLRRQFSPYFDKKDQRLVIGGVSSGVYAVIDHYGVTERESLMSFWEFKKAVFTIQ